MKELSCLEKHRTLVTVLHCDVFHYKRSQVSHNYEFSD